MPKRNTLHDADSGMELSLEFRAPTFGPVWVRLITQGQWGNLGSLFGVHSARIICEQAFEYMVHEGL